jgi:hypothetical protein
MLPNSINHSLVMSVNLVVAIANKQSTLMNKKVVLRLKREEDILKSIRDIEMRKNQPLRENKPKNQNSSEKNQQGGQKNGQLPNKSVERMLDELMKAESETKRKIGGQKGSGTTNRSGKDW